MSDPRPMLPLPAARGLSRTEAAAYVGVGTRLFDEMVADRRMPKPKAIGRRRVWDRRKLDRAFMLLPDADGVIDPAEPEDEFGEIEFAL